MRKWLGEATTSESWNNLLLSLAEYSSVLSSHSEGIKLLFSAENEMVKIFVNKGSVDF